MVASRESAVLAERLIAESVHEQQIGRDQLTLHADRGSSMASKPVAFLLADLGVTKSHSRPHCSNDNPFSEAQFKTLKYRPDFPDRFGCIGDGPSGYRTGSVTPRNLQQRPSLAVSVRAPPVPPAVEPSLTPITRCNTINAQGLGRAHVDTPSQ